MIKRLIILFFLLLSSNLFAQSIRHYTRDSSKYLVVSGMMQFWLRHTELNNGSLINGQTRHSMTDMSIRRLRLKIAGQATERTNAVIMLGLNNVHRNQSNHQLKLLDVYIDHKVTEHIYIGLGKHAWTGLSRYASSSAISSLGIFNDYSARPFINIYNDAMRNIGGYLKGQYSNFDYRLVLVRPKAVDNYLRNFDHGKTIAFSDQNPSYQSSGYIKCQFHEHESNNSPFSYGTYHGEKKLLNLGIGASFIKRQP